MRAIALAISLVACSSSVATPDDASAPTLDGAADVAPPTDAAFDAASDVGDATAVDPCPALNVPPTCANRNVVYREWSPSAKGDGTYFVGQEPWRLGFNRTRNMIWIVKFKTDANTYLGRVSAYGDNTAGVAYISDKPCDPAYALANKLVAYGTHGGGDMSFIVVRNAADAQTIQTNPQFMAYRNMPRLQGGACYYAVFENAGTYPQMGIDANYLMTVNDDCGTYTNTPDCYYLAFDFGHLLQDPVTKSTFQGNVIPGLTQ